MKQLIASRKYLTLALTLGAFAIAAPAIAKDRHAASSTSRLGYAYAPAEVGAPSNPQTQASGPRSAAIRECNKEAEKYSFHT